MLDGNPTPPRDRCLLWVPPGQDAPLTLAATLERRGVAIEVCRDAFSALARACITPGGLVLVFCFPSRLSAPAHLVRAAMKYAPRVHLWCYDEAPNETGTLTATFQKVTPDDVARWTPPAPFSPPPIPAAAASFIDHGLAMPSIITFPTGNTNAGHVVGLHRPTGPVTPVIRDGARAIASGYRLRLSGEGELPPPVTPLEADEAVASPVRPGDVLTSEELAMLLGEIGPIGPEPGLGNRPNANGGGRS